MTWTKSTYEGKTCYERNGERVFSTQIIDAIEREEKEQMDREREKMKWNRIKFQEEQDRETYDEHEHNNGYSVIIILAIVCLLWCFFNFISSCTV